MSKEIAEKQPGLPVAMQELQKDINGGVERHAVRMAAIKASQKLDATRDMTWSFLKATILDLEVTWQAHAKMGALIAKGIIKGRPEKALEGKAFLKTHGLSFAESARAQAFHRAQKSGLLREFVDKMKADIEPPRYSAPAQEQLNQERRSRKTEDVEEEAAEVEEEANEAGGEFEIEIDNPETRIENALRISERMEEGITYDGLVMTVNDMVRALKGALQ